MFSSLSLMALLLWFACWLPCHPTILFCLPFGRQRTPPPAPHSHSGFLISPTFTLLSLEICLSFRLPQIFLSAGQLATCPTCLGTADLVRFVGPSLPLWVARVQTFLSPYRFSSISALFDIGRIDGSGPALLFSRITFVPAAFSMFLSPSLFAFFSHLW